MDMQEKTAQFRARSGRTVRVGEDGTVMFDHANGYLSPASAMDAEEFYQAKRDEELGCWRCAAEPDHVVYRDQADADLIRVVDERTGEKRQYRRDLMAFETEAQSGQHLRVARVYFEAHPERKPWHDAQPGEVWVINIGDDADAANWQGVVVSNAGRLLYRDGGSVAVDQDFIIDGRRIWPEDAS